MSYPEELKSLIATPEVIAKCAKPRVYILHHFKNGLVLRNGKAIAIDGIPRVMRLVVKAIAASKKYQLVITCYENDLEVTAKFLEIQENCHWLLPIRAGGGLGKLILAKMQGLFLRCVESFHSLSQKLKIWFAKKRSFEDNAITLLYSIGKHKLLLVPAVIFGSFIAMFVYLPLVTLAKLLSFIIKAVTPVLEKIAKNLMRLFRKVARILKSVHNLFSGYVEIINNDKGCAAVFIPHHFTFPEIMFATKPLILYLPDYIPHFFERGAFGVPWCLEIIGRLCARAARVIFTNSNYTKSYLPDTILAVDASKVKVLPLPILNLPKKEVIAIEDEEVISIKEKLGGSPYLFYPTQNRPNKNLTFLLQCFQQLRISDANLKLVLTCKDLESSSIGEKMEQAGVDNAIIIIPKSSDNALQWLYQNAVCLSFTSIIEGNFPPQITEALFYGCPVVATRLPVIDEKIGNLSKNLLLVEQGDHGGFIKAVSIAKNERERVIREQQAVKEFLSKLDDQRLFDSGIVGIIAKIEEK